MTKKFMIFIMRKFAVFIQISFFKLFIIVSEIFLKLLKGYLTIFIGIDNSKTCVLLFFIGQTEICRGNRYDYH